MLQINGLCKTFNTGTIDEKVLFNNFSLNISDGDFVSVVGSNGSGKTTLLNVISGTMPIDGGSIILDGKDLTKVKSFKRSNYIARVFQNPAQGTCPNMTIFENMSLADNKAKSFNLTGGLNKKRLDFYRECLSELSMGLEDRMNTKAGTLSGGQRQALALIMATLYTPKLLLLDEHTAALDPRSADIVMSLTDKIIHEKKITALMVTHNLRYAADYGTRTIMMHEGDVVIDVSGDEKKAKTVDDYLQRFNEISIECGN